MCNFNYQLPGIQEMQQRRRGTGDKFRLSRTNHNSNFGDILAGISQLCVQLCSTWGSSTTETHEWENPGHKAHGTAATYTKCDFSLPFPGSSNAPSPTTQNNTEVNFVEFIKKKLNSFINSQHLKGLGVYMQPLFITVHIS